MRNDHSQAISKIVFSRNCHSERSEESAFQVRKDSSFTLRMTGAVFLKWFILFMIISIVSCTTKSSGPPKLKEGMWRAMLTLDTTRGIYLPFNFEVKYKDTGYVFTIINGEEKIVVDEIATKDKAIVFQAPVFDSQVIGEFTDEEMTGLWLNYARREKYVIDFYATYGQAFRFKENCTTTKDIAGRWKVLFSKGTKDETAAIGVFKQNGSNVQGTFLTETGDYRYLDGCIDGDTLMLSCFDGAHAFLFNAVIEGDNSMTGEFWSGIHHNEKWTAEKNDSFQLPNADSLTVLKPGYKNLSFSFPSINGDTVSLSDEKYKGKVVIVQVMGSWCPNCKDETAWLAEIHNKYNSQGLEVIALAFEKARDNYIAVKNIKKLKDYYGAKYDFLLAGPADKTKAGETLSVLNHIIAFPTTIFIDKKGVVRKIHTGFSGPGTGEEYDKFTKEMDVFLKILLEEK